MPKVSPFALHVHKWRQGCGSEICSRASNVCHMRGELPCDLLLIGEAPGETENTTGYPFTGPAGILLDEILEKSIGGVVVDAGSITEDDVSDGEPLRLGWCNLVGCIPYDEEMTKAGEPDQETIDRCAPRLQEIIDMASPRLIVCVGRLAWNNVNPRYKQAITIPKHVKVVEIVHPEAILRAPNAQKPYMIDRCMMVLKKVVSEVFEQQSSEMAQKGRDTG